MPTHCTHMLRITPGTARRLKAFARENGQIMDGAINTLLDAQGFPKEHLPDPFLWAGDQEGRERFATMLEAAEAAGDDALAGFARTRLAQIAATLAGEEPSE